MKARDVMTPDVTPCTPEETVESAAKKMQVDNVGALPVIDKSRRLLGIITDRDVTIRVVAEGRDPRSTRVEEVMTRNPRTVQRDDDLDAVAKIMADEQVRRIPVVDEQGKLLAMISQGDLARKVEDSGVVHDTVKKISKPAKGEAA